MEQRPLRLGDIVDDYCPRERRMTNHAIVAIVDDVIRQTRCTACDTEHVYKGKPPLKRRTEAPPADEPGRAAAAGGRLAPSPSAVLTPESEAPPPVAELDAPPEALDPPSDPPEPTAVEEPWPVHRRLIRATLPRIEGEEPPARPIPEFTMHQRPQNRGGGLRFQSKGNGNVAGRGDSFNGRDGNRREGRNGNRADQGGHRSGRRRNRGKRSR